LTSEGVQVLKCNPQPKFALNRLRTEQSNDARAIWIANPRSTLRASSTPKTPPSPPPSLGFYLRLLALLISLPPP